MERHSNSAGCDFQTLAVNNLLPHPYQQSKHHLLILRKPSCLSMCLWEHDAQPNPVPHFPRQHILPASFRGRPISFPYNSSFSADVEYLMEMPSFNQNLNQLNIAPAIEASYLKPPKIPTYFDGTQRMPHLRPSERQRTYSVLLCLYLVA